MTYTDRADRLESAMFAAIDLLEGELKTLRGRCLADVLRVKAGMNRRTAKWSVTTDVEQAAYGLKDLFNELLDELQPGGAE
jgi:hypothetical protein